jgi:hypothetical protein
MPLSITINYHGKPLSIKFSRDAQTNEFAFTYDGDKNFYSELAYDNGYGIPSILINYEDMNEDMANGIQYTIDPDNEGENRYYLLWDGDLVADYSEADLEEANNVTVDIE